MRKYIYIYNSYIFLDTLAKPFFPCDKVIMLRIFYNEISSLRNFLIIVTGCADVLLRITCKRPRDRGTRINPMCIVERNALAICERPVLSFRKLRGQTQESRIRVLERPFGRKFSATMIHSPSSYVACKRIAKWIDPLKRIRLCIGD